jgi:signal transduction histidine kinase
MKILKIENNTSWIIVGTITFAIIFIFAVVKIYEWTLNEATRNHQLQQLEMAKTAKVGISTYLDHLVEDMHLLTFFNEIQFQDNNDVRPNVDYLFNHYEKEAIRTIFVTDINSNLVYSKGEMLPGWVEPLLNRQIEWAKRSENWEQCWYSQVQPNFENDVESGFSFLMLVPIIQKPQISNKVDSAITVGMVGYLVSFDLLIQQYIAPLKLSKSDFAWIIDGNGRLIFHPRHSEMLLRTTKETTTDCIDCHSSFEVQNRMLNNGESLGEYTIGEEPTKIMAYVPISLKEEKWILVISTFLPAVTSDLRYKFRLFFILGFVILTAIISFGLLLYYVNSKRIRAEEANRQSEKMQQLHEQLNQASKLASIGELVDSVAHEINTPAGIIAAQADALILQPKTENTSSEELRIIKHQIHRISQYTRSLLNFSKRMPHQPIHIRLDELLNECLYLLDHRFREQKVSIIKNYPENLPALLIDRLQVEQVFINLFNNSVDALESNGKIEINVWKINQPASVQTDDKSLNWIVTEIKDNGIGIPSDKLDQIFEPFFSTKLLTKGTGLGLYISKAIIQRHRGKIEVSSVVGEGTTFRIFLPATFKEN